jgi:hypothetical protein
MASLAPVRPVATLDDFLSDPNLLDELESILDELAGEGSAVRDERCAEPVTLRGWSDVRVKARWMSSTKRERMHSRDFAALLIKVWRQRLP